MSVVAKLPGLFAKGVRASLVVLATTACSGVTVGGSASTAAVTYYQQVQPILATRCVGYHFERGIAPFPLRRYEQTQAANSVGRAAQLLPYANPLLTLPPAGRSCPWACRACCPTCWRGWG
jgi:hypothetical protein